MTVINHNMASKMNLREIGLNRNEWDGNTAIEISCGCE